VCQDQALNEEYEANVEESFISRLAAALEFLQNVFSRSSADFLIWLGSNGFDAGHSEEEKKAILCIRFALTGFFYANRLKSPLKNDKNESTPSVEYLVPAFKYYSAIYQDMSFQ
jgi:hypothetical protein